MVSKLYPIVGLVLIVAIVQNVFALECHKVGDESEVADCDEAFKSCITYKNRATGEIHSGCTTEESSPTEAVCHHKGGNNICICASDNCNDWTTPICEKCSVLKKKRRRNPSNQVGI